MAEWLKAHAWKACIWQHIEGSNPFSSAKHHKKSVQKLFSERFFLLKKFYFPLFDSATYFSKAPVIDGVPGEGAKISTRKPCSKASF